MLPFFQFIGFNWQICVALIPGLAAREVAVSALATVYSVGASEADAASSLRPCFRPNGALQQRSLCWHGMFTRRNASPLWPLFAGKPVPGDWSGSLQPICSAWLTLPLFWPITSPD